MNGVSLTTEVNGLDVDITQMTSRHLAGVVEVHMASFDGFFLTFLGPRFLRLIYSELLREPGSVALVAQERVAQAVVGFAAGVTNLSGFYRRAAVRRAPAFAFASLRAIAKRPAIVLRLARTLAYPPGNQRSTGGAVLMALAVHPEATSSGIGQRLVTAFIAEMRAQRVARISVMTDKDNNARANRFYKNIGFEVGQTVHTPEGRRMIEYQMDLNDDDSTIHVRPSDPKILIS
jgi:ribosomal protein S18 acetylase RimI-like enzyme